MINLKGILHKDRSPMDSLRCEVEENKRWTYTIEERIYELKQTIELLKKENDKYSDEGITRITEIILELKAIVDKNHGRMSTADNNFLLHTSGFPKDT